MTIRELQKASYACAQDHGFFAHPYEAGSSDIDRDLLLIAGEVVEAQNELRNGRTPTEIYIPGFRSQWHYDSPAIVTAMASEGVKPEGFPIELADAALRVMNLAEHLGIDLETVMEMKHACNMGRPMLHGGKRF